MRQYRIDYSVTVDGDTYEGTVEVMDRTMTTSMARQYAAHDLPDDVVHTVGFDVNGIDVSYEKVNP